MKDLFLNKLKHPCFNESAHSVYGRIHLPVAPACNIQCNYCERSRNEHERRPGVYSEILTSKQAVDLTRSVIQKSPEITVVGIAGPGESLANESTFKTLKQINEEFPEMFKCLSTNGLVLLDNISRLKDVGLDTLTVTINATDPVVASKIYSMVNYEGNVLEGIDAAALLLEKQWSGLKAAVDAGMIVKINSVFIPGVNDKHLVEVAKKGKECGAHLMNIMPLIPLFKFKDKDAPLQSDLRPVRDACEKYLPQFRKCKQCRADAIGIPGKCERDSGMSGTPSYHF